MRGRAADAYLGPAWLLFVLGTLVLPAEASASRPIAVPLAVACAGLWWVGALVIRGRAKLPAAWVERAKRPLSSRSLLLLGAAVGPVLSYFVLACLRVVAYGPTERPGGEP